MLTAHAIRWLYILQHSTALSYSVSNSYFLFECEEKRHRQAQPKEIILQESQHHKGIIIKFYGSHLFFLSDAGSVGCPPKIQKLGFLRHGGGGSINIL